MQLRKMFRFTPMLANPTVTVLNTFLFPPVGSLAFGDDFGSS